MKEILLLIFLITNIYSADKWESEAACGMSGDLDLSKTVPLLADDCATNEPTCCVLTGIYQLKDSAICVKIANKNDITERVKKMKEFEEDPIAATKLKLYCKGETARKLQSDCGPDNPSGYDDCQEVAGGKCCFVDVDDGKYKACKKFPSDMDDNTISEAVLAAKTIDVKLVVDCSAFRFKYKYALILLSILYLFV